MLDELAQARADAARSEASLQEATEQKARAVEAAQKAAMVSHCIADAFDIVEIIYR